MVQKESISWDGLRVFLAVARSGSARQSADDLGASHSTISRQIARLELQLNARLFDRTVSGFQLTADGEELVAHATAAEEAVLGAQRQLAGKEGLLRGAIEITTSDVVACHLIMEDLTAFSELYPEITLSLHVTEDLIDLRRREADVAIRILPIDVTPPENLIGRRLARAASCYYGTPDYLQKHDLSRPDTNARWIGWDDYEPFPQWVRNSPYPHIQVHGRLNGPMLQVKAAEAGMGIAVLPCFLGEQSQSLVRLPGAEPYYRFDIWLLSHPDLRDTARLRTFRQHIAEAFATKKAVLLGGLKI